MNGQVSSGPPVLAEPEQVKSSSVGSPMALKSSVVGNQPQILNRYIDAHRLTDCDWLPHSLIDDEHFAEIPLNRILDLIAEISRIGHFAFEGSIPVFLIKLKVVRTQNGLRMTLEAGADRDTDLLPCPT